MNLHSIIWIFIIILISFSNKRCPLLLADCQVLNKHGYLTVEPGPLFLIGSNLTVYCHLSKCNHRAKTFLELNGKRVAPREKVNCTTTIFSLFNVRTPYSALYCILQKDYPDIVDGLDLHGGLPPDKPKNITCETSRSSDFINCSWERGQETHVSTTYNISVNRENGTQMLLGQIEDAEEIEIPRAMIDENTKYQLIVTAYNQFGTSQSDPVAFCGNDIVIPETPRIIQIKFGNNSIAAILQWETAESSEPLRSFVRLRTVNGPWEAGEGTELSEGLIQVKGLKPLTEYEFQMRTCNSISGLTHISTPRSTTSKWKSLCSKWSPSVTRKSPGKGPYQQLHAWRMLGSVRTNSLRSVTVLWKPPSPEDFSGELQHYKIFWGSDQKQEVTCHAALSQCLVEVPAEVQALSVSAITSYGASPPAEVSLRHSGDFGPVLRELAPAADESSVFVSWSWPGNKHWSTPGGELLCYVLEWTSIPAAEQQWQKLSKDEDSTSITGLTAGVRYKISLYAVTTRGVSAPSTELVYCKEEKPVSGPNLSILEHGATRIQIQWDELPVSQQRGFITNYTMYSRTLESSSTELRVTVSGSDPRQKWLDCPEGGLALQMTASTSAGEGPRGSRIFCQPATPAVGLVIGIVFITTLFIAIIANLMCWSCVRKRIKQKCISCGPGWFDNHLPKPGNSIAIRLLEDGGEPLFSSAYSDPPLSPISFISQGERDDVYPNIHMEISADPGTTLVDSQLEHVSYKPQIATLDLQEAEEVMETEEELRDVQTSWEEDRCVFGGLLRGFLSNVEVDFSDSPVGLTLSSVTGLLLPKTPATTTVINGAFLLGTRVAENDVEADSSSLDLHQGEIMTHDTTDTCLSQYTVETTLTDGYFPQVAAISSTTICDAQR
ncbi:interleukin-23 receptor isoform X2 [Larimichthys crocea]|uniref:interleukin-23 receptor isoform X2 n=1 Tax=Larimichthys crocea TaxID=215358 RepID=UPI000F5F8B5F|nr:interleukin-12 receptor subunit beta-2-like isoform X2 [Larimichthys crocea]